MDHDMNNILNVINPAIQRLYTVIHADEKLCGDIHDAQSLIVATCVAYLNSGEIQLHELLTQICQNPHYIIPIKLIRKIKLLKINDQEYKQYKPLADLLSKKYIVMEPIYVITGDG